MGREGEGNHSKELVPGLYWNWDSFGSLGNSASIAAVSCNNDFKIGLIVSDDGWLPVVKPELQIQQGPDLVAAIRPS
jgi:hypothetical protein